MTRDIEREIDRHLSGSSGGYVTEEMQRHGQLTDIGSVFNHDPSRCVQPGYGIEIHGGEGGGGPWSNVGGVHVTSTHDL